MNFLTGSIIGIVLVSAWHLIKLTRRVESLERTLNDINQKNKDS